MKDVAETGSAAAGKDAKVVTIFVNTRAYEVAKKEEISFAELVELAFSDIPPGGNVAFSVMYERGHGNVEGTLVDGQSVKVKDGMRFDVTPTDRS